MEKALRAGLVRGGNRGLMDVIQIIAGLILLYLGAECLVRGSSSLSI
jgi:Ca2+/Na+ antiporter